MTDELKVIKEQLDKQVFSKHTYQSQKKQIMSQLKTKSKKPNKLLHTVAAIAAVLLFSIITVSYVLQEDANTPAQNNNHTPEPTTPIEEKQPEKDQEDDKTIEEIAPPQQEKTGEEWIAHFKEVWNTTQRPYQQMQLTYRSNNFDRETVKRTHEVNLENKDGNVKYKSVLTVEREQGTQHLETSKNGKKVTLVDHTAKSFETTEFDEEIDTFDDPSDVTLEPLFPLEVYETLFTEAYSWEVDKVDEKASWVRLHAKVNPNYQDYTRTKATIKIDLDTGIVLELTMYAGEKIHGELFVDKVLLNDEVTSLDLEPTIPSDYTDVNKLRNERVSIDSKWETESNLILKQDPQVSEKGFFIAGEDSYLSFIFTLKQGTSEQKAKELAQRVVNTYTEKANSSTELKQRGISIWDQYSFNILVIIEPSEYEPTYNGVMSKDKHNGIPLIKWN